MTANKRDVVKLPHHMPLDLCTTRAKYRQGKKLTAVKVYTVNNESQHVLVCGVPALGLQDDLRRLCARFGDVKSLVFVPKYAEEEFTDVYHVQYARIQSARYAKHHLDGREFFGGILHVCYVPEMESLAETRAKLIQRRKEVARRTRNDGSKCPEQSDKDNVAFPQQYHRTKKHPALPLTAERMKEAEEANCIWQGVPRSEDPRTIAPSAELLAASKVYGPLRQEHSWALAGVRERRIMPNCSYTKPSTKPEASSVPVSAPSSSLLRFIPRQVKRPPEKPQTSEKRIVFLRNKNSGTLKRKADDQEDTSNHDESVKSLKLS